VKASTSDADPKNIFQIKPNVSDFCNYRRNATQAQNKKEAFRPFFYSFL